MRILFFTTIFLVASLGSRAQQLSAKPDASKKLMTVETACGGCQFGLGGKGCNLAVRFDGRAYYVNGAHIDSFGDAHAKNGFCNAIRKAEVQGTVSGDRFVLTYYKLAESGQTAAKAAQ